MAIFCGDKMVIYIMNVTLPPFEFFLSEVSEERIKRMERYRLDIDKRRGMGAEALLNYGLRRLCPEIGTPVLLQRDEKGKPHTALSDKDIVAARGVGLISNSEKEVNFSFSHSGDYAVCAIAQEGEEAVGVDIEEHKKNHREIAERFFQKSEAVAIKSAEDFYLYWTLKESFIKAVGLGLSMPLESFEALPLEDGGAAYRQSVDPGVYLGKTYAQYPGYTVSACAKGEKAGFPERIEEVSYKDF